MRYVHVSKGTRQGKGTGRTYNIGRNKAKREDRAKRAAYKGPAKTPKGTRP